MATPSSADAFPDNGEDRTRPSQVHFPVAEDHSDHSGPADTRMRLDWTVGRSGAAAAADKQQRRSTENTRSDRVRSRTLPSAAPMDPGHGMSAQTPKARETRLPSFDFGKDGQDFWRTPFSDEYDLYPRLLQDVQRALALKARREARLKSTTSPPSFDITAPRNASLPSGSSAPRTSLNYLTTPGQIVASELDFSPSTVTQSPRHPVPTSSNNGMSLDWTGPSPETEKRERRWTMSTSKRKSKDTLPLNSVLLEKQASMHSEKIARIRSKLTSTTLRKAAITSEQLQRRYAAVYRSLGSERDPLNLARVARWYGAQPPIVKSALETAEPFTWLRHLERRRSVTVDRPLRHVTALIVEEYLNSLTAEPAQPPATSIVPELGAPSPQEATDSSPFYAHDSPHDSSASDEHVSFEPFVGSGQRSVDSGQGGRDSSRPRLKSSPSIAESSEIGIGRQEQDYESPAISPASSHLRLEDLVYHARRRRTGSEDGFSSARHSEDQSDTARRRKKVDTYPSNLNPESRDGSIAGNIRIVVSETAKVDAASINSRAVHPSGTASEGERVKYSHVLSQSTPGLTAATLGRKAGRASLPLVDRLLFDQERKRQLDADEERMRQEYELKSMLLDETVAQNQRIRQLLHRVANGLREYESLQSNLMNALGLPHRPLPQELLDAIGHDPASVTGPTRRFRGWRAVEAVQARMARQRETLRIFLSVAAESGGFPEPASGLDKPVEALIQSLDALESHRTEIAAKAQHVTEVLTRVKAIHAEVKREYNDTLSHTSVIYPELSHIIALEESYRDQYQQLWMFGMDALTFVLDTVTPFWRTYGKTIGEDVRDFLVIPWYRNEFTGEAKSYPIERFPTRSFTHWVGLLLFFAVSLGVAVLQGRAAVSSLLHFRLSWISHDGLRWSVLPFFWMGIVIQWCVVLVEWAIVCAEFSVLIWWLGWFLKMNN